MLSVVVDDNDMGVTHVIRGDDHLTNAARQSQLFRALGWEPPTYAHIPLIHGPDGAKLSKRHGALGVAAYRDMGYLPEAMRNYLLRLGWAHGDEEIIATQQAIAWFDLGAVGRSPARFDFQKLDYLNGHYIREADDDRLTALTVETLTEILGQNVDEIARTRIRAAMPGLKARAKTVRELADGALFLVYERPLAVDDKAARLLDGAARRMLGEIEAVLEDVPWTEDALEAALRQYAEDKGLKFGAVAQPLRAALTGRTTSPGIFDVLTILGREESIGRIHDQAAEHTDSVSVHSR